MNYARSPIRARSGRAKPYAGIAGILLMSLVLFTSCNKEVSDESLGIYARASGLYSQGRFSEAAAMLDPLKSFVPALVLKGKSLYFSGQADEAEKVFQRALARRPSSTEASLYLARIAREKGDDKKAMAILEGIIADDPSDIRALRLAADISLAQNGSGTARGLAYLDKAAEASSEVSLVFLERARIKWIAGNGPGALADIRAARAILQPNSILLKSIESLERTIMGAAP